MNENSIINIDEFEAQTALGTEIKISKASLDDSWQRSSSFGLDPNGKPVDAVISEVDFYQVNQKNEYIKQFVMPELELLYNQIAGTNFMVAYADSSGIVIDALRDEEFKNSDAGRAVVPGSIWTEQYRGTNALGLCLHTGSSQIVAGRDHFFRKLGGLSCFAAPIYNPRNEIVGMIDATSDASSRQHHTLALVKLACMNVENRLFIDEFQGFSVISFHARHEYLSTTSVALLAVDELGFIEGANTNAQIMLNGLNISQKRHFGDVFEIPFSNAITRLGSNEIIRIHDVMGSAVFMELSESTNKRIVELNSIKKTNSLMPKFQSHPEQKNVSEKQKSECNFNYIIEDSGLKKHLNVAGKALKQNLCIFIEGPRGSGKKTTAIELHRRFLNSKKIIEIKCDLLSEDNFENELFGEEGKLAFFRQNQPAMPKGKLYKAIGGSLFLKNVEHTPLKIQRVLAQVLEANQEFKTEENTNKVRAIFVSSRISIADLHASQDMDPIFLENICGASVIVPSINQRIEFKKIATEILRQISSEHKFSQMALNILKEMDWPGQIKQLKNTIRLMVAKSNGLTLHAELIEGDQNFNLDKVVPCFSCAKSPIKKENCILIKKTFLDSGRNISLVSRRLGVSRNTIYKHTKVF